MHRLSLVMSVLDISLGDCLHGSFFNVLELAVVHGFDVLGRTHPLHVVLALELNLR